VDYKPARHAGVACAERKRGGSTSPSASTRPRGFVWEVWGKWILCLDMRNSLGRVADIYIYIYIYIYPMRCAAEPATVPILCGLAA
jgi:hypothetical protein